MFQTSYTITESLDLKLIVSKSSSWPCNFARETPTADVIVCGTIDSNFSFSCHRHLCALSMSFQERGQTVNVSSPMTHMALSDLDCILLGTIRLKICFVLAKKVGQGRQVDFSVGCLAHNSCLDWLQNTLGWHWLDHSYLVSTNGHSITTPFSLQWHHFWHCKEFQSGGVFAGQKALTVGNLLISGCNQRHQQPKNAQSHFQCQFQAEEKIQSKEGINSLKKVNGLP